MSTPTTQKRKVLEFDAQHLVVKLGVRNKDKLVERIGQDGETILDDEGNPKEIPELVVVTLNVNLDKVDADNKAWCGLNYVADRFGLATAQECIDNGGKERSFTISPSNSDILGIRNHITAEQKKMKTFLANMAKNDPEGFKQFLADIDAA